MKFTKKSIYIVLLLILILTAVITFNSSYSNKNKEQVSEKPTIKTVKTINLNNNTANNTIKTTGIVKPISQINVTATTKGTLKYIHFKVGDEVKTNQMLGSMFSASTLTSLNNAKIYQANSKISFETTKRLTEESIKMAEAGVENSLKNIESTTIALKNSKDNLENTIALKEKTIDDTKTNALNLFNNNLNTIFTTLDKVNYIINYDNNEPQISGIDKVLSKKNIAILGVAKSSYPNLKNSYLVLSKSTVDTNNIKTKTGEMIDILDKSILLVNNTIDVLYNTINSADFPESALNTQKEIFTSLKSNLINIQTKTKTTLQSLENLHLALNQEIEILKNNIKLSETQVDSAKLAHNNSIIQVSTAHKTQNNQISTSKLALDSASGQLNLSQSQAGDLSIKAPISGTITKKFVELGTEINPGQKIVEISNTEKFIIEVNLSSADIYRIEKNSKVKILDNLIGVITSIDPAADPATKKVKVEITVEDDHKKLIQETFVNIEIPTKELAKTNANSVFIPLKAVSITQSENYVFIVEDNIAIKKNVKLGKTEGALIEILEGLNKNAELIFEGGKNLDDKENVIVSN